MRPHAELRLHYLAEPDLGPSYRRELILALGKTGDRRAQPFLEPILVDPDPQVTRVAPISLERLR